MVKVEINPEILEHAQVISDILAKTKNPHTRIEIYSNGIKMTSDEWFHPREVNKKTS